MEIKELQQEFIGRGEVRGFTFKQVHKDELCYVYEVCYGGSPYYEVFKRVVNTQYGNVSYPSRKAFGLWAWTTYNQEIAFSYVNRIHERKENK